MCILVIAANTVMASSVWAARKNKKIENRTFKDLNITSFHAARFSTTIVVTVNVTTYKQNLHFTMGAKNGSGFKLLTASFLLLFCKATNW